VEKWLIIGLGNPGTKYAHTRHNAGFDAVDAVAKMLKIRISKISCNARIGRFKDDEKEFVLAKPQSFMNLSGQPVKCLADANQIPSDHWIILYDDIDHPDGTLKLRKTGSSGGHKGITSIQNVTGKNDFFRIKIGIGRPDTKDEVVDFVLSKAEPDSLFFETVKKAAEMALFLVDNGYEMAGNRYNTSTKKENGDDQVS
jgi:PTH1 family peptidyl-tRNA hydrolase